MEQIVGQIVKAKAKFGLGQTLATPGALDALGRNGETGIELLARHATGDWGDLWDEDKKWNDMALKSGSRLMSAYHLADGTKLWVITERANSKGVRIATTILLPEEY